MAYSSCGLCAKEAVTEICRKVPPVASPLTMPAADPVRPSWTGCRRPRPIYQDTGGTHGVALATPDGQVFFTPKTWAATTPWTRSSAGPCWNGGTSTDLVALLSGRISFEMALKAIRAGIPILAAVSAPTTMALTLAQELNLTPWASPGRTASISTPIRERSLNDLGFVVSGFSGLNDPGH